MDFIFYFLNFSLANYHKLIEKIKNLDFSVKEVARKKLFFEELIIIESKLN